MGRMTISNLSREMKVSRPLIYRAIDRLGIERKGYVEFSIEEWEALKNEIKAPSEKNKKKVIDSQIMGETARNSGNKKKSGVKGQSDDEIRNINNKIGEAKEGAKQVEPKMVKKGISAIDVSTLKERLERAKIQYDINDNLIIACTREMKAYIEYTGKITCQSHNGAETVIPAIVQLRETQKLNIALCKLITDLEADLDLMHEEGENPFV